MKSIVLLPVQPDALPVHTTAVPNWLTQLGVLGLFSVAVIDSSVIPLPIPGSTDLLLLWLLAHGGDPWLLAPCAIAGSILGGYTTWHIGRRGGEAVLRHYVPARILGRVVGWVEAHRLLAVFLPAMLPPPIPLSPFLLASGALGVSRRRFLIVYGASRTLRYSLVSWLAVAYGRHVIRAWSRTMAAWSIPLLSVFICLLTACLFMGIWKVRGARRTEASDKRALQAAAGRASEPAISA